MIVVYDKREKEDIPLMVGCCKDPLAQRASLVHSLIDHGAIGVILPILEDVCFFSPFLLSFSLSSFLFSYFLLLIFMALVGA